LRPVRPEPAERRSSDVDACQPNHVSSIRREFDDCDVEGSATKSAVNALPSQLFIDHRGRFLEKGTTSVKPAVAPAQRVLCEESC
jgi:hypothetical protein